MFQNKEYYQNVCVLIAQSRAKMNNDFEIFETMARNIRSSYFSLSLLSSTNFCTQLDLRPHGEAEAVYKVIVSVARTPEDLVIYEERLLS